MSDRLGIGIIGAGGISREHARSYLKFGDRCRLVGVCDVVPEAARRAREEWGADFATNSADELLARPDIAAVSVTVPTALHAPLTVAALRAGKHVLCEKPMAASAAQAKAMVAAAEESGRMLMMAMKWRFRPETIAARAAIDAGKLGRIYYAQAIGWQHRGVPGKPSFIRRDLAGGGGLTDNGIYQLDTVLHLMGHPRPLAVSAQVGRYVSAHGSTGWDEADFGVEDFGACFVRLEGGIALFFAHSWAVNFGEDWGMKVAGTDGGVELELAYHSKPFVIRHGTYDQVADITPDPLPAGNTEHGDFGHEVLEFLTAIADGRPSPVPGDPFYYSNLIFDAAFESAQLGREVAIEG